MTALHGKARSYQARSSAKRCGSIRFDSAAGALESKGFYIRSRGSDGFLIGFKPTLKKVVSDRRASLDEDEVKASQRLS